MASEKVEISVEIDTPNGIKNGKDVSRTPSMRSNKVSPTSEAAIDGDEDEIEEPKAPRPSKKGLKMTILILFQVLVLLLILSFLITSLFVTKLKEHFTAGLEIWKWCLFTVSVLCGFALVMWVYWPIMFLVEKAFRLDKEVIYFIYGLRKSGAVLVWWVWVLLMWLILLEHRIKDASPRSGKVLRITTRSLISLVAASVAWIMLTIGLRLLSVKCRFNRYIDKVELVARYLDVLRRLARTPLNRESGMPRRGYWFFWMKNDVPTKELTKLYTFNNDKLNFLNWEYIFDHAQEALGMSTWKKISEISTEEHAMDIGSKVFDHVISTRQIPSSTPALECIDKQDLLRFIIKENIPKDVFTWFGDKVVRRRIDKKAFSKWVVKVYQERKKLIQALNDNKTATKRLGTLLKGLLVIVCTVAWLLWIDVLTTKLLAAFLTAFLGCAFIFGETIKNVFQSIIFVFLMHPYDIGDNCIIDNIPLEVEQMNILTTVFVNKNNENVYHPNFVLANKVILNTSRSSNAKEVVQFCVDMKTTTMNFGKLKKTIQSKFKNSELVVDGFDSQDNIKMSLKFGVEKTTNDNEEKEDSKTRVIFKLVKILQGHKIKYSFPSTDNVYVASESRSEPAANDDTGKPSDEQLAAAISTSSGVDENVE